MTTRLSHPAGCSPRSPEPTPLRAHRIVAGYRRRGTVLPVPTPKPERVIESGHRDPRKAWAGAVLCAGSFVALLPLLPRVQHGGGGVLAAALALTAGTIAGLVVVQRWS